MGSQTFWVEPSYPSHDSMSRVRFTEFTELYVGADPLAQVYGKGVKMLIRGQKGKARIGSISQSV